MIISYNCPDCGHDWTDTWSCMVNGQCPACGAKDIEPLDPDLSEAFETVLHMARELLGQDAARADRFPTERAAIDAVQVYYILNVKGN